jgi:hypothetical protein
MGPTVLIAGIRGNLSRRDPTADDIQSIPSSFSIVRFATASLGPSINDLLHSDLSWAPLFKIQEDLNH